MQSCLRLINLPFSCFYNYKRYRNVAMCDVVCFVNYVMTEEVFAKAQPHRNILRY